MTDQLAALTPEQGRALWHDYLRRQRMPPQRPPGGIIPPSIFEFAVLTSALPAASNASDSPGTGTAKILVENAGGDFIFSDTTIDVRNAFEHISLEQDTIGVVVRIRGRWYFIAGDCSPLSVSTLLALAGS
jgi:hypothetical protein